MDTRQFGRRECAACTDKLSARTGTTVQCEAGLCKSFYHVTCAQRYEFGDFVGNFIFDFGDIRNYIRSLVISKRL